MLLPKTKTGFIAVIGRPNVGKSTLINALIGSKVSIISKKAQTTRYRINGILTRECEQFIFVDTPGFQNRYKGDVNYAMNQTVLSVIRNVDIVLHVIETGKWLREDMKVLSMLKVRNKDSIVVINKVDKSGCLDELFPFVKKILDMYSYSVVVPVSAIKSFQLDKLLDEISKKLPIGSFIFEPNVVTDRSAKFMASELLREKVFRFSGAEVPYGSTVSIDQWLEGKNHIDISACITVNKDRHKPILIGKNGLHMKLIATEARKDISFILKKSIYLEVYVRVRKKGFLKKEIIQNLHLDKS